MKGILNGGELSSEDKYTGGTAKCSTCGGIYTWDDCSYQVTSLGGDPCVTCMGGFVCGGTCVARCVDACATTCTQSCNVTCDTFCGGAYSLNCTILATSHN